MVDFYYPDLILAQLDLVLYIIFKEEFNLNDIRLGKPSNSKTDESSEKFQTAFEPTHPHLGKISPKKRFFWQPPSVSKICIAIFQGIDYFPIFKL